MKTLLTLLHPVYKKRKFTNCDTYNSKQVEKRELGSQAKNIKTDYCEKI